jgi:hypothetical protein
MKVVKILVEIELPDGCKVNGHREGDSDASVLRRLVTGAVLHPITSHTSGPWPKITTTIPQES